MNAREIIRLRAKIARDRLLNAKPKFTTTWADMFYSLVVYGAFPFVLVALAGGILGGLVGLVALQPAKGFTAGFLGVFLASGLIVSVICSLPLAIISHFTRKPKINKIIDGVVQRFRQVDNDRSKQKIIDRILIRNNSQPTGIRSFSSFSVIRALSGEGNLDAKWQRVNEYISNRTGANYTHNGKKLFNTICEVVTNSAARNEDELPIHKLELATIFFMIFSNAPNNQGIRLFSRSNVIPKGILQLRQCLLDNGLKLAGKSDEEMMEFLSKIPLEIMQDILVQLKEIVYNRGDSTIFRSDYTQSIYNLIDNAGNNPESTFKALGVSQGILVDLMDENSNAKQNLNLIKLHLQKNRPLPAPNRLGERVSSYLKGK